MKRICIYKQTDLKATFRPPYYMTEEQYQRFLKTNKEQHRYRIEKIEPKTIEYSSI